VDWGQGHGCSATTNLAWWMHGCQLVRMISLQTLQTKMAVYDNHYRGLAETVSLDICCVAGLIGWISAPPPQPHSLQWASHCHAFCQYFMILAAYSVMYLVLSLSFYPERQPVAYINVHMKLLQKDKFWSLYLLIISVFEDQGFTR